MAASLTESRVAMVLETVGIAAPGMEPLREVGLGPKIAAYTDRIPETHDYTVGMLTRAPRGVWNSRLLFAGDFSSLGEALEAIGSVFPETDRIRCYEYTVDNEFPVEVPPLVRSGDKWRPAG